MSWFRLEYGSLHDVLLFVNSKKGLQKGWNRDVG